MSAMPERMIKAYVSKERIEVPHPNPLIATYVYDGEPRAPDEVEGWIVIAPHSEPPVPESALLAAEARVREVEAERDKWERLMQVHFEARQQAEAKNRDDAEAMANKMNVERDKALLQLDGQWREQKNVITALRADLKAAQELEQLHLQNLDSAYAERDALVPLARLGMLAREMYGMGELELDADLEGTAIKAEWDSLIAATDKARAILAREGGE